MGRQQEYTVRQIQVEGLFLSLKGALKRAYLCEYAGYAVDAAEWTDTAAMTPALIADDVARNVLGTRAAGGYVGMSEG